MIMNIENDAIRLFNEMAKICHVVVILGNHDGLMLNADRMDTVSPIIEALNNPNISFYKDLGCSGVSLGTVCFWPFALKRFKVMDE